MVDYRQALPVGFELAGDYRVTGVLGQGGFGITYKAEDLRLGAPVAIKEYFPSELAWRESGSTVAARSRRDEDVLAWGRAKFLDEARTLARFRHPSIVRVSRLFEANNTAYMVLDFEMGPNLAEWRTGLGHDPTQAEVDHIATRLIDAVGAVHEAGILHRDIKPANVIMRDGTEPVLIDFGAARQALSAQSRTVHAIVTPGYSPKEQYAVDLDRQGAWSDIYALGATFYFLVTGNAPPDALSRDLGEEMRTAASARGTWRPGFLDAIDRAMSVRAEDRPQTTGAWRPMLFADGAPRVPETPTSARAQPAASPAGQARRLSFDELPPADPLPSRSKARARGLLVVSLLTGAMAIATLAYWVGVVAPARDAAAWQQAVATNTVAAYRQYLAEQPSGRHSDEARRQIALIGRAAPEPAGISLSASPEPRPGAPTAGVRERGAAEPPAAPASPSTPQPPQVAPPATQQASATQAPATDQAIPAPASRGPSAPPEARPPSFRTRSLPPPLQDADVAHAAATAPSVRWRLSAGLFGTGKIAGFSDQVEDFAAELARASGHRIDLASLTGDAAIPRGELMQRLRSDRDLLAWHSPLIESGLGLEFAILAGAVPFGLEPGDHVRWLRADGARLLEQAYADLGTPVRAIPCGIAGRVGAWFRKEIRSPLDFRGLKVRGGYLMTRALRRLEAAVVTLPSDRELPSAFAGNRLDANFDATPLTGIFLAQPRPAAVYHYPGVHSPSYLFELLVGPETWSAMAEPHQRLIDEVCRRNLDRWAQLFPSSQNDVLNRIRTQRITVRPFTGPVREALKKAVDETIAEEAAKSSRFREVMESYARHRR